MKRSTVPALCMGLLASGGCCLNPKPSTAAENSRVASQLGSLPVASVMSAVGDALLGDALTRTLKDQKLVIQSVKIALQIEDDRSGDFKAAVLATAEGSISRSTAKTLSFQFSLPAPEAKVRGGPFDMLRAAAEEQRINTAQLVEAVQGAAVGLRASEDFVKTLNLTDKEIDYEIDFLLTRTALGGIDITIGSVGVTANATWTRKTGDQITVTFKPK